MVSEFSIVGGDQFAYKKYYSRKRIVSIIPLVLLLISFFYCLPLGRFSLGRFDSDFRIFDIAILFAFLYYFSQSSITHELAILLKSEKWFLRWLKILATLVVFSVLIAMLYSGTSFLLPTLIRVYRFTAYLTVPFLVFAVVRTKADYLFFFGLLFWLMAVVGSIAFLQGLGFLPNLWPEIWQLMYSDNDAPVATLSPHHKHIGVIMLVGVCIGIGYLIRTRSMLLKIIIGVSCLIMFTVPLFAGTRTYLLGFAGVIPGILFVGRGRGIIPIMVLVIGAAIFLQYYGSEITSRVEQKFDDRITARIEKLGYEGLYRERTIIYLDIYETLAKYPHLLITGTGYQNIHRFIGATGAHNNYLQVLMELGLFGLFVFVSFLVLLWRNLRQVSKQVRDADVVTFSNYTWVALCGILLTMFVGETFWGQAAMFTLAGQLSFLFGLIISPYYWISKYKAGYEHHFKNATKTVSQIKVK
jgi:O-antigen ligase